jgi:hypothetical protein
MLTFVKEILWLPFYGSTCLSYQFRSGYGAGVRIAGVGDEFMPAPNRQMKQLERSAPN